MKKKIYIAGKVTGLPIHEVTLKFGNAQKVINDLGFHAINPLEVVNDWHCPWQIAMKLCLKAMLECDAVVLLPDWQDSKGAVIEKELADKLEIPIFNFNKLGLEVLQKNSTEWNNSQPTV